MDADRTAPIATASNSFFMCISISVLLSGVSVAADHAYGGDEGDAALQQNSRGAVKARRLVHEDALMHCGSFSMIRSKTWRKARRKCRSHHRAGSGFDPGAGGPRQSGGGGRALCAVVQLAGQGLSLSLRTPERVGTLPARRPGPAVSAGSSCPAPCGRSAHPGSCCCCAMRRAPATGAWALRPH